MQLEQVYRQNMTVKVMKNMTKFLTFLFWLGFQMLMTLKSNSSKSFISAPVRLIDERALICDHSQLTLKFCQIFEIFEVFVI